MTEHQAQPTKDVSPIPASSRLTKYNIISVLLIVLLLFVRRYVLAASGVILEFVGASFHLGMVWQERAQYFYDASASFSTYEYIGGMILLFGVRIVAGKILLPIFEKKLKEKQSDDAYRIEGDVFHSLAHYRLLLIPLIPFAVASAVGLFFAFRKMAARGMKPGKILPVVVLMGVMEMGIYYFTDEYTFFGTW